MSRIASLGESRFDGRLPTCPGNDRGRLAHRRRAIVASGGRCSSSAVSVRPCRSAVIAFAISPRVCDRPERYASAPRGLGRRRRGQRGRPRALSQCFLRSHHIDSDAAIQARPATPSISAGGCSGSPFQSTNAKQASPTAPNTAPVASSAAARSPRELPLSPCRSFLCRSRLAISVAAAGKIAGKARKTPANTGPKRLASSPVATVMRPPNTKRSRYWCQAISRRAEKSTDTLTSCARAAGTNRPLR